jgi:large subunit ribosomal protein L5
MQFLEYFYLKTFKFDLYNKFSYNKTIDFPRLKKIILNFGCKTPDLKSLSSTLLALELLTHQKGHFTTTKSSNIVLKLRKGYPVGCKVTLRKKQMFWVAEKILATILPKAKSVAGIDFNKKSKKSSLFYVIQDTLNLNEFEANYYLFNNLPNLSITLVTKTNSKEEFIFLINSFQFPYNKI